jgi:hypothetical protein
VKLESRFHNHIYVLEYVDFPFILTPEKEVEAINSVLDGLVKTEGAKLIKNNWGMVARHSAMHFIMQMPKNKDWSGGTTRGHLVTHNRRLYIQYAYVPRGESLSFDVGEYLRSMDLP